MYSHVYHLAQKVLRRGFVCIQKPKAWLCVPRCATTHPHARRTRIIQRTQMTNQIDKVCTAYGREFLHICLISALRTLLLKGQLYSQLNEFSPNQAEARGHSRANKSIITSLNHRILYSHLHFSVALYKHITLISDPLVFR